ncbi:TRAP transporter small permease subunit [Thalassospira sp.]|uniref:TRAP transporter small permease subunit n=1 Tax=Thalassospira sp. TaxID=1912094 RepID=UPI001B0C11F1|nr:TRAP transporter small permease subunit [Thalassospira sp.]MBO6808620.1 TRAP transporter small permease subunit [Thalassospira sp.]MBO6839682.1 TRAP transporter small permease subunit [Thalassospira sp.]
MSERLDDTPMAPDVPQTSLSNQEALSEAGWLGRVITVAARGFAVCILAAMAILVMEVFLRYVFNRPTIWAHETSIFLSAVTFIFGGLYCVARNTHIRVVLIYDVVRASLRHLLDVVISIACLGASLFFAWASWLMVKKAMFRPDGSFFLETTGSAWNSPAPAVLKIFLFCVLVAMSLQFLILTFNYARGCKAPKGHDDV